MTPYSVKKPVKARSKRKPVIMAIAVLLLCIGVFAILEKTDQINFFKTQPNESHTSTNGIDYSPPTEQDAKAVEDKKDAIVKQQESQKPASVTPTNPSTTKKNVKPIIVNASATAVRSYIPAVVENGGTCTATITKAGQPTIARTAQAAPDAQNTTCIVQYDGTGVAANSGWKVTVTYTSTSSEGTSDAFDI
jgi:cytoskeletal protein RodZ